MKARALAALCCALVLSACGVPEVEPTKLLPGTGDGGPMRKVKDTVVVERAVKALVEADTGAFSSELLIGGGKTNFVDAKGAWRLSESEGWMTLASTSNEGESTLVEYRIFRSGFYVRSATGADIECWTPIGTPASAPWTPVGHVALPSQVQALASAKGSPTKSPETSARGTVLLTDAVGVLGPVWTQAVKAAGDKVVGVRVPVTFGIKKDRFTGWTLLGTDLLAALRKAKVRLTKTSEASLPTYMVRVSLSKPGGDVSVIVPDTTCGSG